ncbi:hypothetical protein HanXRQr2_Chr14g0628771 [Helianthus annuus]|uniref:Uncharacterized protein n=1 Tax=Helianthus annuus TaxID=4232 RepID=A0A9K3H796_HELAN|nr:hypothetical protein HanXRQr2_Chr14g0628771 [Helianthus annuus]KAJ0463248.1 hypothetical protein HanHA300_Chr14g0513461 [Helianthus annuus]KAJ0467149.1 hypothetical protein HanIR_Chr14g0682131 [Helianthus annuus]KAJ0484625.1 hypothetical protein HanHA89_Chr14g0558941 [Helianthus annuus]KAJ0655178.1 hypothetical protein HanLR1_Chr14g0521231 [Helianthus annuus]
MFLYTTTLSIEHHHKSPLFLNTYDFNKETPGIQAQVMLSSIIILHFSSIHNLWARLGRVHFTNTALGY